MERRVAAGASYKVAHANERDRGRKPRPADADETQSPTAREPRRWWTASPPALRLSSCRGIASARRGCATLKPKYLRDRASSGRHLGGFESPYTPQGAGASGRQEKTRRGTSL